MTGYCIKEIRCGEPSHPHAKPTLVIPPSCPHCKGCELREDLVPKDTVRAGYGFYNSHPIVEIVLPPQRACLSSELRESLLRFDTCKIANAIEKLGIRLKNEGFTAPGLHCATQDFPGVVGYAVTGKVRGADPPMKGYSYYDLADWWELILSSPAPRIAVIEDTDKQPGTGAVLSDIHAHVLAALDCEAVITNGAIRNVPQLAAMGFTAFSASVTMSHAYVHMIAHQVPVEIFGLTIAPCDLLYADIHGALSVPEEAVPDIIQVATEQAAKERQMIDLCQSGDATIEKLRAMARTL